MSKGVVVTVGLSWGSRLIGRVEVGSPVGSALGLVLKSTTPAPSLLAVFAVTKVDGEFVAELSRPLAIEPIRDFDFFEWQGVHPSPRVVLEAISFEDPETRVRWSTLQLAETDGGSAKDWDLTLSRSADAALIELHARPISASISLPIADRTLRIDLARWLERFKGREGVPRIVRFSLIALSAEDLIARLLRGPDYGTKPFYGPEETTGAALPPPAAPRYAPAPAASRDAALKSFGRLIPLPVTVLVLLVGLLATGGWLCSRIYRTPPATVAPPRS